MANDLNPVNAAIYQRLGSSSIVTNFVGKHPVKKTWQIYFGLAPQDHRRPCIVFVFLGSEIKRGTGGRKIASKMLYAIKVITEGNSIADAAPVLTEIEQLFTQDQLATDSLIMGMSCSSAFNYPEVLEGGIVINHTGYQVEIFSYNTL